MRACAPSADRVLYIDARLRGDTGAISGLVDIAATAVFWSLPTLGEEARGATVGFDIHFLNLAVAVDMPLAVTWVPIEPSEEAIASNRIACSSISRVLAEAAIGAPALASRTGGIRTVWPANRR